MVRFQCSYLSGQLFYWWIFQPFAGLPLSWHIDRLRDPFFIITGPDIHWGEILVDRTFPLQPSVPEQVFFLEIFEVWKKKFEQHPSIVIFVDFLILMCDMSTSFTAVCKWKKIFYVAQLWKPDPWLWPINQRIRCHNVNTIYLSWEPFLVNNFYLTHHWTEHPLLNQMIRFCTVHTIIWVGKLGTFSGE